MGRRVRPGVARRQMLVAAIIASAVTFSLWSIAEASAQPTPPPQPVDILGEICGQPSPNPITDYLCGLLQGDGMNGHIHEVNYDGFTTYTPSGAMGGKGVLR